MVRWNQIPHEIWMKTPYALIIQIDELPRISMNSRSHWTLKNRDCQKWDQLIAIKTIGIRPKKPLKRAEIRLTRYSSVCPDWDNLVTTFKNPVDALVSCGIIEDDNFRVIGIPQFYWEKCPPKLGKIRIEVYELDILS